MKRVKLNPAILRKTECLRQTAMQLRRQAEVAEAMIVPINVMLNQVGTVGLVEQIVVLGRLIHVRDDSDMNQDSGITLGFQAALLVPEGIGAVVWDMDEFWEYRHESNPDLAVASQRFVKFEEHTSAIKALILPEVGRLFTGFCRRLPRRFRPRLSRHRTNRE